MEKWNKFQVNFADRYVMRYDRKEPLFIPRFNNSIECVNGLVVVDSKTSSTSDDATASPNLRSHSLHPIIALSLCRSSNFTLLSVSSPLLSWFHFIGPSRIATNSSTFFLYRQFKYYTRTHLTREFQQIRCSRFQLWIYQKQRNIYLLTKSIF